MNYEPMSWGKQGKDIFITKCDYYNSCNFIVWTFSEALTGKMEPIDSHLDIQTILKLSIPHSFYIWLEDIAFGDFNNDGVKDAAVIIVSKGVGLGAFYKLAAVINKDGNPYHTAYVEMGDRVEIKSLIIKSGKIFLKMITHGPNDAACCPTMEKTLRYKLIKNKLTAQ